MTLRELWARLTSFLRRRESDRDLEDEIAAHLDLAKADHIRNGMDPEQASRLAAVNFGSVTSAKEKVWDQCALPGASMFFQDARYAFRGMCKAPGFTLVCVLTIAIGIGMCSAAYTVLNTSLFRSVPGVKEPDRLVALQAETTYPNFEIYRDQHDVAASAAAFIGPVPVSVAPDGPASAGPVRIQAQLVSLDYFSTLGVEPILGRFFNPGSERPGAAPTIVVTERFWRTQLHADAHAVGTSLRVNGRRAIIIGVAPKDFFGAFPIPVFAIAGSSSGDGPVQFFLPVTADPAVAPELQDDVLHRTNDPAFRVLLRLAPGVTMAGAEARLNDVSRRLKNTQPDLGQTNRDKKARLISLMPGGSVAPMPPEAHFMIALFYAFIIALILSLICANLGGLMLARGSARAREIAIRLSVGASRVRLIRQMLTESLILAAIGGAAGFAAAYALFDMIARRSNPSAPAAAVTWSPDIRVMLFTGLITALAAAGFGLMPALANTRLDVSSALKTDGKIVHGLHRRFGVRNLFVVYQVAAAMTLVLIMGFAVLGFRRSAGGNPGFDPAPLYLFSLDPVRDGYTPEQSAAMLAALPGQLADTDRDIEGVSLADQPPLTDGFPDTPVSVTSSGLEALHSVVLQTIGPRFFSTLGAQMVRGAEFSDRDLHSAPGAILPAVLNQTAARELFGDADPLGQRIRQDNKTLQVIGIVRYDHPAILINKPSATIFLPLTTRDLQRTPSQGITVVVRARTPLDVASLRRNVGNIDSSLTIFNLKTMREHLADVDRLGDLVERIYGPAGMFGLLLACLGLAGVTAQSVERRRKEIGIRMALGARREQLLRLVMREAATMTLIGAAAGFACAYAFARVLSAAYAPMAQVIAEGSSNRLLTVGIPSLLILLAAIACYLPARRSATIDPVIALREE